MSAALSLATAISQITKDMDMDTVPVIEAPERDRHYDMTLLVRIERAASWLANRTVALETIQFLDREYPGLVSSDRRQFQNALNDMAAAIEAYRNA